jgi:hypothetical protein
MLVKAIDIVACPPIPFFLCPIEKFLVSGRCCCAKYHQKATWSTIHVPQWTNVVSSSAVISVPSHTMRLTTGVFGCCGGRRGGFALSIGTGGTGIPIWTSVSYTSLALTLGSTVLSPVDSFSPSTAPRGPWIPSSTSAKIGSRANTTGLGLGGGGGWGDRRCPLCHQKTWHCACSMSYLSPHHL